MGGALLGFLAGTFGIGVSVRGTFLTAFDLPKAVYISTAGATAMFNHARLSVVLRLCSFHDWSMLDFRACLPLYYLIR